MTIPKPCLQCGCVTGGNSYCDECQRARDSAKNTAKGRRGPGASAQFIALRRKVLRRDSYQCRIKGCTRSYGLEVHKIGGGYHAGSIDNYITLCPEHHREVERRGRGEIRDGARATFYVI